MGLASLMVRLGLDATSYNIGLKRAESAATAFGSRIKAQLGALFSVAALSAFTKAVIDWADKLQDASEDLRISTTTLQEWEQAAVGTRATLDDMIRAYEYLSKQHKELNRDEIFRLFYKLAEQFRTGQIGLAKLNEEFGRGAAILAGPFSKGLLEAADNAKKLHQILAPEQINNIAKVADAWDRAKLSMKAYGAQALSNPFNARNAPGIGTQLGMLWRAVRTAQGTTAFSFGDMWERYNRMFSEYKANSVANRIPQYWPEPGVDRAPGVTKAPTSETTIEQTRKWLLSGTTSNQQIGAFNAAQPILVTETKEQTRQLKKIAENTDALKKEWDNS